jgi:lipoate-protein ligase A
MMNYFLRNFSDNFPYILSHTDILQAESLADSKYKTWEWNWAYGPEYTFKNSFEINKLNHSCELFVKDGIIRECSIEGSDQMKIASKKLMGCRHMVEDLSETFRGENIILTEEEIFNFF